MTIPSFNLTAILALLSLAGVLWDGLSHARGRVPGRVFELSLRACFAAAISAHAVMVGGLVWAVKFLASVAFVPYVCELLALQLGLGGGRYHYKQAAGLLLIGGVPLLVAVAWVVLLYTARIVSLALEPLLPAADSLFWSSVIGGVLLVAIDLLLDPIAVREGRWGWTPAGGWFGVPLVNFGAWFVTTWLSLMVAGSVAGPLSPVLNHSHRWMILLPVAGLGLSCLHLSLLAGKHGLTKLQPLAIIEAVTLFAFYGVAVLA